MFVATCVIPSPSDYSDVMTTTTHKSLYGPRGAMIIYKKGLKEVNKQGKEMFYDFEDKINEAVFPGLQGGPRNHTITSLVVALKHFCCNTTAYNAYREQVMSHSAKFAEAFQEHYGTNDIVQKGVELLVTSVSKIDDSMQARYKGQIVRVVPFSGSPAKESDTVLHVKFTTRPSSRLLEEV
ncbi:serine hydroxymethyltransferase, mitochondrial [Tanacetum coccineum]